MVDVLGITNIKIQQRMKVRIHECNEENPEDYTIFGWGRNDKGQLGTNPSANVTNPIKIKLPDNCVIEKCLGDRTLIRNIQTEELFLNKSEANLQWESISQSKLWDISTMRK